MSLSRRSFVTVTVAGASLAAALARRVRAARRARVPLVYDASGTLLVAARIGGAEKPVRFVLDTGASRSAISETRAGAIGLAIRDEGGGEVEGTAGVVNVRACRAPVAIEGVEPVEIDFTAYGLGFADPECVGILGAELLHRAPFRIGYRERVLEWDAELPAATVPMTLDNGIPRVEATLNGIALPLRVDTGAAFPPGEDAYVNVTEAEAAKLGLSGEPVAVFSATGTGGAPLKLPVHRLKSLAVAGRDVPRALAIVQPKVGYFARADAVGFLGNAVLDKLDPAFDYAKGRFGATAAR